MALSKQTVVDQIEVTRDSWLQIRLALEVVDGDQVLTSKWHRTAVYPGGDIDAQFAAVNANLGADLDYPLVDLAAIDRIKSLAAAVWSDDVVAAYAATQGQIGN